MLHTLILNCLMLLLTGFSFLPLVQKLDDGILHLLCRVGSWKIFTQLLIPEGDTLQVSLLHLIHDFPCCVQTEVSILTQLF